MVIHIFIAHMGIGGAERVCVNLANEFAEMGNEVHILVLNLENDVNTHLLDSRVQVHPLGVSRLRYAAPAMLRYVKKYRPPFLFCTARPAVMSSDLVYPFFSMAVSNPSQASGAAPMPNFTAVPFLICRRSR